jgi:hypothetical protein
MVVLGLISGISSDCAVPAVEKVSARSVLA